MSARILVLRPRPNRTAESALALGLDPIEAPIFSVRPLAWEAPDPARFDAILLTSANAPRHAGPDLAYYLNLPCQAVGETTAEAARAAGFEDVRVGPGDGVAARAALGPVRILHLCGRDHIALPEVERRLVYAADPVETLPEAAFRALGDRALVLLHSPRAAALFAALVDKAGLDRSTIPIAAISPAAVEAAGPGWKQAAAATIPRDSALLELAAELCQKAP